MDGKQKEGAQKLKRLKNFAYKIEMSNMLTMHWITYISTYILTATYYFIRCHFLKINPWMGLVDCFVPTTITLIFITIIQNVVISQKERANAFFTFIVGLFEMIYMMRYITVEISQDKILGTNVWTVIFTLILCFLSTVSVDQINTTKETHALDETDKGESITGREE